jgi:Flp pilus assembly pilin Flp
MLQLPRGARRPTRARVDAVVPCAERELARHRASRLETSNMTRRASESRPARERLVHDEQGLTTVEYVIVLALIAAGAVGLWSKFGGELHQDITRANTTIRDHLSVDSKAKEGP